MKKFMLFFVGAIMVTCGLVGCGEYQITLVNPLSPYFFNARSLDLNYRLDYVINKSILDSVNKDKDTNRIYFTPWVPYGYYYPY